jgi:predicted Fe-S protein YdhL (DUF1289 family)
VTDESVAGYDRAVDERVEDSPSEPTAGSMSPEERAAVLRRMRAKRERERAAFYRARRETLEAIERLKKLAN